MWLSRMCELIGGRERSSAVVDEVVVEDRRRHQDWRSGEW